MFLDRTDAGEQLARALTGPFSRPVVLGIPRGGVPVAVPIARALGAELGVAVSRKIGAPGNPEVAIGAVTSDGTTWLDRRGVAASGASEPWLAAERARQVNEAFRREAVFGGAPDVRDRDVIVVDDGIATGATAFAVVKALRARGAARITLAVPCGSKHAIDELSVLVDRTVCLIEEPRFQAVGQYYEDFAQVSDAEVLRLLGREHAAQGR